MKHIGLFGGSFNPVHCGHLLAAESVLEQLALDEILFLPAACSPFKARPEIRDTQRLDMLRCAIEDYPAFKIDSRELKQPGPSYTINTLVDIAAENPQTQLYLLIGMDAWEHFERWKQWREIMDLCHLIVLSRPGYSMPELSEYWRERLIDDVQMLKKSAPGKLVFVTVPASNAASNEIRECIKQGRNTCNDLPEAVRDYIEEQQLYRN